MIGNLDFEPKNRLFDRKMPRESECLSSEVFLYSILRLVQEGERYSDYWSLLLFRVTSTEDVSSSLNRLAVCLRSSLRNTDYLARFDSNTLAVILLHANLHSTQQALARLWNEITLHLNPDCETIAVGVSWVVYPSDATTASSLIRLAVHRLERE